MRYSMSRGFTLIELMIVIAIIAIIAAIAIPNLLRSRMAANEASAISSLRTICSMQTAFKRTDYNIPGYTAGLREYARPYYHMYNTTSPYTNPATCLGFIDRDLATAHLTFPIAGSRDAKAGYKFYDMNSGIDAAGLAYPYRRSVRFGINASPASYNMTGVNSFLITDSGVIYQRDYGFSVYLSGMYDDPSSYGYITVE